MHSYFDIPHAAVVVVVAAFDANKGVSSVYNKSLAHNRTPKQAFGSIHSVNFTHTEKSWDARNSSDNKN